MAAHKTVFDLLQTSIISIYTDSRLYKYGSSANGLASNNSDMDLTIVFKDPPISDTVELLTNLGLTLQKSVPELKSVETIRGAHPILIMKFLINDTVVDVDLSIQNTKTVINSFVICQYTKIDRRFPILFSVIRRWAKTNHLFGGGLGGFNSYTIALMIITFLQSGVKTPVLPFLNRTHPKLFAEDATLDDICVDQDLAIRFSKHISNLKVLTFRFFRIQK